jgi:hypothetical protein
VTKRIEGNEGVFACCRWPQGTHSKFSILVFSSSIIPALQIRALFEAM